MATNNRYRIVERSYPLNRGKYYEIKYKRAGWRGWLKRWRYVPGMQIDFRQVGFWARPNFKPRPYRFPTAEAAQLYLKDFNNALR